MAKHLLVVMTNAAPGQDEQYNEWYSKVHVYDTIDKLQGFRSAQRYVQVPFPDGPNHEFRYLAVYEIDEENLDTAQEQFHFQRTERAEALAAGRPPLVPLSDTHSTGPSLVAFFSPLTERLESTGGVRAGDA